MLWSHAYVAHGAPSRHHAGPCCSASHSNPCWPLPHQVCKTHWSNKHCTCRRADCECFPAATYEPFFAKSEKVCTHHNQTATLASNKNASKSVRDKLKAQQMAAAAAICDDSRRKTHAFTAKQGGPSTK